ncbi:unnamed protein product [Amoebophrya sp. A120]|nr:unnamed protein product [Amoebophrya sp. A120]|eukprot:GSA120T00006558001.1
MTEVRHVAARLLSVPLFSQSLRFFSSQWLLASMPQTTAATSSMKGHWEYRVFFPDSTENNARFEQMLNDFPDLRTVTPKERTDVYLYPRLDHAKALFPHGVKLRNVKGDGSSAGASAAEQAATADSLEVKLRLEKYQSNGMAGAEKYKKHRIELGNHETTGEKKWEKLISFLIDSSEDYYTTQHVEGKYVARTTRTTLEDVDSWHHIALAKEVRKVHVGPFVVEATKVTTVADQEVWYSLCVEGTTGKTKPEDMYDFAEKNSAALAEFLAEPTPDHSHDLDLLIGGYPHFIQHLVLGIEGNKRDEV